MKQDEIARASVFVQFPKTLLKNGQGTALISISDRDTSSGLSVTTQKEVSLVGPFN